MVYTCCVPGCKSGCKPCQNEKISLLKLPNNEEHKQKWIAAIPHKNWQVTKTTKVCAKHFTVEDIENQSTDLHDRRCTDRTTQTLKRLRLKSTTILRIFPNLPKYPSLIKLMERSKASTSPARQEIQNATLQQTTNKMFLQESIDSFEMLKNKIHSDHRLPDGYMFVFKQNFCLFHLIKNYDNADFAPELLVSVVYQIS